MGATYNEDICRLAADEQVPWDELAGKTVVVTGATGLIGGLCARALLQRNATADARIDVVLPVRDVAHAQELFGEHGRHGLPDALDTPGPLGLPDALGTPGTPGLRLVPWDAMDATPPALDACDALIHCASNTDSRFMVEHPVETIATTVRGTASMLALARETGARMVFASSMEVYGAGSSAPLRETDGGALDAMSVRSSYPQAKQLAETLCASYASEYGVAVCVARLAQTFGAGISRGDRRIFAEVARCCLEGRDIVLHTDGSKRNMYCSTTDAVRALLLLVARGAQGRAYNVAREDTFCSVLEMSQMVAREFGHGTRVVCRPDSAQAGKYAVSGSIGMDTTALRALGWRPTQDLRTMYERMIADWREVA